MLKSYKLQKSKLAYIGTDLSISISHDYMTMIVMYNPVEVCIGKDEKLRQTAVSVTVWMLNF